MKDESKTKRQLIQELLELRTQIVKLEKEKGKREQIEEALRKSEIEAKRLAPENAVMVEIGQIISSTLKIEEVYEGFAQEMRKLIDFDRLAVNIIIPDGQTFTIPYFSGRQVPGWKVGRVAPLAGTATEEVFRTGLSLFIQGKSQEEITSRFPRLSLNFKAGLRSFILVPLISESKVIGVLYIQSARENAYTEKDLRLAERVGAQIAGAMANAQLFRERERAENTLRKSEEEARRLAQENALVAEIGRIVGSAPNIDVVFERFTKAVAKLLPFDRLMINLNSPQKDASFVRYVAGMDIPNRRVGEYVPLAGSATAECMRTKSSLLIQPKDIEEVVDRFPGLLPSFESGIRSIIMVPLISEDQIIGILSLRSTKPEAYTDQDVRVAESISSQIAGVVANAQLYIERMQAEEIARKSEEEARRLAQENAVMAEIGRIVGSTLDIEEVYERFAEEMHKLISFDRVAVNIIDPKSYTFNIPYVSGTQVTYRRTGEVIPLAGTGTEEILRTRTSILIHEENREAIVSRCPGLVPIIKGGFQSIMMVPLISENEVIGVLNIQSTQADAYTESDLRLAERVSSQVAGGYRQHSAFC